MELIFHEINMMIKEKGVEECDAFRFDFKSSLKILLLLLPGGCRGESFPRG